MTQSILCPVDYSEQSRHALRWAGAFAERYKSRLLVLSVVDPLLAEAARIRFGRDVGNAEDDGDLREFATAAWSTSSPPATVLYQTQVGQPADVILDVAAREAADLIVMGTRGLGGVRKWVLGSTTERVLRRTPVAVLAVPTDEQAREPASLQVRHVLAATDFSEAAGAAISYAAQIALDFSASLTLIHAVAPITVPPQWTPLLEQADEERVTDARKQLEGIARELGGPSRCEIIIDLGRPADVIRSAAAERDALIVMGLTGDRGVFAPRPGSIAYHLLSATMNPVLVVPPRRPET